MQEKIAIIYDRLNTMHGGAEQVLLALHRLYPQAVFFSSVYDSKRATWAKCLTVKTSFLQNIPLASRCHRYLVMLMPLAFESLDLANFDIIISVTSAEAKGVVTRRDQLHLCYLLSPPRYLYHYREAYLQNDTLLRLPLVHQLANLTLNYLRKWDQIAIFRPDAVIPIAKVVSARAQRYYENLQLESVIYPPIDSSLLSIDATTTKQEKGNYFLLVSRLVPYKNIESAILACQKLRQKLIVVGSGPEEKKLRKLASSLTSFRKNLPPTELAYLYRHCQAVLSPGIDDFGIVALEANLFGKAIIINQLSGVAELITDKVHGIHMPYQEGDSQETITANLVKSIQTWQKSSFDPQQLRKNALKCDTSNFVKKFDQAVQRLYKQKIEGHL